MRHHNSFITWSLTGHVSQSRRAFVAALFVVTACGGEKGPTVTGPEKPAEKVYAIAALSGDKQRGPAGEQLTLPVTVQLKDESGRPATGFPVEFAVSSGGGSVAASTVTTDAEGRASTSWKLGWTVGPQTLWAHYGSAATGSAFINAEALVNPSSDVAIVRNAASATVTVLLLGDRSNPEGRRLSLPDSVVYLAQYDPLETEAPAWMAAFSRGAPPTVMAPAWTARSDTIPLAFAPTFKISLTVLVLETFEQNSAIARRDVNATAAFWRNNPWGLELGDVRIVDATEFANSPVSCSSYPVAPDPNTINIYYATNAQIGTFGGFACSARLVLIRPQFSAPTQFLLAHELGHTFGLGHVLDASNFMNPSAANGGVTTGQIFDAHLSPLSAINAVYHFRLASDMNACCILDTFHF